MPLYNYVDIQFCDFQVFHFIIPWVLDRSICVFFQIFLPKLLFKKSRKMYSNFCTTNKNEYKKSP